MKTLVPAIVLALSLANYLSQDFVEIAGNKIHYGFKGSGEDTQGIESTHSGQSEFTFFDAVEVNRREFIAAVSLLVLGSSDWAKLAAENGSGKLIRIASHPSAEPDRSSIIAIVCVAMANDQATVRELVTASD